MATGTEARYPPRPHFWAAKYSRSLIASGAPVEIGPVATALCHAIAAAEDAKRYGGPVAYHCAPLMRAVGVAKWETVDRGRTAAVDAGWLVYVPPATKRAPGLYWTTLPDGVEVTEGTIDDGGTPEDRAYRIGFEAGLEAGQRVTTISEKWSSRGDSRGDNAGVKGGILHTYTSPEPGTGGPPPNSLQEIVQGTGLDGLVGRKAIEDWMAFRAELGKPLSAQQLRALVKQWRQAGESALAAEVTHSIANGWKTLQKPEAANQRLAGDTRTCTRSSVGEVGSTAWKAEQFSRFGRVPRDLRTAGHQGGSTTEAARRIAAAAPIAGSVLGP